MSTGVNPYDAVPYDDAAYVQTHPNRTATIATLLGLNPAPVEKCRVLELASASGGNLIPMAYECPESEFIGVDYSAREVEVGQEMIRTLGLTNVELRTMDVRDIDQSFGQFDYIIVHGLYSWVTPDIQDQILAICKQNLAPNGIAYVSYNSYPGWHMFDIARNAMLFRTRNITDPDEKAKAARDFIDFLADSPLNYAENPWGVLMHAYTTFMQVEAEYLTRKPPAAFLHDELENVNAPCYFFQFMERAEKHGLEYLAESHFPNVMLSGLPQQIAQEIEKMSGNLIEMEQYMDFVRNRTFRQTLLCHQGTAIDRGLDPERIHSLYVSSPASVGELDEDEQKPGAEKFVSERGLSFVTNDPIVRGAFHCLIQNYPQIIRMDELVEAVRAQVYAYRIPATTPEQDTMSLASYFLQAYSRSMDMIELHAYRPHFVWGVSERPVLSPVAREQAKRGKVVTNMRHEAIELHQTALFLAPHLDGTNDRSALLEKLKSAVVLPSGGRLQPEAEEAIAKELDDTLNWMAKSALLVG